VNPFKLIGWAALAICVIGAFVEVPYSGLILVLLGLVAGVGIATEDSVRVIVTALALNSSVTGALMNIPELGSYLTAIFSAFGAVAAGASLTLISRNVWNRYKP
jgi:hypothetical protein